MVSKKEAAATPTETMIYFSKRKGFTWMIVLLIGLIAGVAYAVNDSPYWLMLLVLPILLTVYVIYVKYKEATNALPQIILNEQGIQTCNTEFLSWSLVKNEEVVIEGFRDVAYLLKFDFPNGHEELRINEYNTNMQKLNNLLCIYRKRFENVK